jgi:acyl-coenzyme A thioesterase PaaI-like protein
VSIPVRHHDLCFGCGLANVFGLGLELRAAGEGVAGRFFVKQDHQGPPGHAHGGILAAALDEAMALAALREGELWMTARLEVDFRAPAPVGAFVAVEAALAPDGGQLWARASARAEDDGTLLAEGRALFLAAPEWA